MRREHVGVNIITRCTTPALILFFNIFFLNLFDGILIVNTYLL